MSAMRFLQAPALLAIVLGASACSTTRPWSNKPLGAEEAVRYDGLAQLFDSSRLPDVLVANFSVEAQSRGLRARCAQRTDAAPFRWRGR
ncbi:MAG: hypothetical protein MZW92_20320 [Comamonadaceae bacterium]|nr:hypothetical protein [Comamonadaceae bacterium]